MPELDEFVDNIDRVGWLGFWRRKPPLDPTVLGFWSQDPSLIARAVRSGGSGSGSGGWDGLGGWRVDLDNPSCNHWLQLLIKKLTLLYGKVNMKMELKTAGKNACIYNPCFLK